MAIKILFNNLKQKLELIIRKFTFFKILFLILDKMHFNMHSKNAFQMHFTKNALWD
jgi:hypothetical protein